MLDVACSIISMLRPYLRARKVQGLRRFIMNLDYTKVASWVPDLN